MKKFIVPLLLAFSVSPAFAQVCQVDMVDDYKRVIKTFSAYSDGRHCTEALRECRKEIALSRSSRGYDCIARNSRPQSPTPVPGPAPMPQPTPYYGVSVAGTYYGELFSFVARNNTDVSSLCTAQLRDAMNRSKRGAQQRLFFTVNNNYFVYKSSTNSPCNDIAREIQSSTPRPSYYMNTVSGYLSEVWSSNERHIQFGGANREELLRGCMNSVSQYGGSFDEIHYSLNNGYTEVVRGNGSFWSAKSDICRQILTSIESRI